MKSEKETPLLPSVKVKQIRDYSAISLRNFPEKDELKSDFKKTGTLNQLSPELTSMFLQHLAPFFDVADRSRLARTSVTLLNFVKEAEWDEKNKKKGEFKRKMIGISPHAMRNRFRLLFGHVSNILPGGLIAPENHTGRTLACPILTAQGDRFFKLQGMMGRDVNFFSLIYRSIYALTRMPCSLFQCGCIVIGGVWGSYLDYRLREKVKLPAWKESPVTAIFENSRIKTAVKWADAWNPCGSEPEFDAGCSFIEPPLPAKSVECAGTCISSEGEFMPGLSCNDLFGDFSSCCATAVMCILGIMVCYMGSPFWVCQMPCRISSCLGFICGYCCHNPLASFQADTRAESDQPGQQMMI